MRLNASAFLYWAALVAVLYGAGLVTWQWAEPLYLRALAGGVIALRSAGILPAGLQAVAAPDHGLVVMATGVTPLAVPQTILGADLALTTALILGTPWLSWRDRMLRVWAGLGLAFAAHVATIVAQVWVNTSASTGVWATWNLWTTLYQGKVVPIAIWSLLIGLTMLHRTVSGREPQRLAAR